MQKGFKAEKENNLYIIKPVMLSLVAGMSGIFIIFIIFALLMSAKSLPLSIINTLTAIAGAFGGFITGFVSGKLIRRQGLFFGAVCGALLSFLILTAGFIAFGFQMQPYSLVRFIIIITASTIGGVLGVNTRKR